MAVAVHKQAGQALDMNCGHGVGALPGTQRGLALARLGTEHPEKSTFCSARAFLFVWAKGFLGLIGEQEALGCVCVSGSHGSMTILRGQRSLSRQTKPWRCWSLVAGEGL